MHVKKITPGILVHACEWDKNYDISKYLKDCECIKSLADDLLVTCDEIEDTPNSTVIKPSNGINDWLIAVAIIAITYLLLFMTLIVTYYMKHGLTIPYLLSQ